MGFKFSKLNVIAETMETTLATQTKMPLPLIRRHLPLGVWDVCTGCIKRSAIVDLKKNN
jgi:hypothetical protein